MTYNLPEGTISIENQELTIVNSNFKDLNPSAPSCLLLKNVNATIQSASFTGNSQAQAGKSLHLAGSTASSPKALPQASHRQEYALFKMSSSSISCADTAAKKGLDNTIGHTCIRSRLSYWGLLIDRPYLCTGRAFSTR